MKKLHFLLFVVAVAGSLSLRAQSKSVIETYILKFRDIAMAEMARTGVPASITLAQGIHETGAGTSHLVLKSNNHFGIKCKAEWTGEKVYHDDDARGECFRRYDDPYISYKDHSDFLRNRSHYASLFNLDPEDYEGWAHGLKKAGYATNPKYPQILIKLIRDYNLQDYTLIVLGKKERNEFDPSWAGNTSTSATETASLIMAESSDENNVFKPVYPEGVFSINETKVIAVSKGTSYLRIAEENNISLARLLEFNDLANGDIAPADGLLFLQRKRKTGAQETHTVAAGETLYSIAQAEGIRLESLLQYNKLSAGMQVAEGEKLNLKEPASATPKLGGERLAKVKATVQELFTGRKEGAEAQLLVHVVQPKETVYGIAKKYEVGVDDVMKWNDMDTTELKIGQQIKINKSR